MYEDGRGVPQDYVLAHMWFNLAAALGHPWAANSRARLAATMTDDQIAEAERLAREWKPKTQPSEGWYGRATKSGPRKARPMTTTAETLCRRIYDETRCFYDEKVSALRAADADHGFRILYGPPTVNAPILFLAYQPGGDRSHHRPEEHKCWPQECDYATQPWLLARRMQQIWSLPALERSTGLNVVFFRSPRMHIWNDVPRPLRKDLEQFSYPRAEQIVRELKPNILVVIGLSTFPGTNKWSIKLQNEKGRVLIRRDELWGIPAYAVIHLCAPRSAEWTWRKSRTAFPTKIQTQTLHNQLGHWYTCMLLTPCTSDL